MHHLSCHSTQRVAIFGPLESLHIFCYVVIPPFMANRTQKSLILYEQEGLTFLLQNGILLAILQRILSSSYSRRIQTPGTNSVPVAGL